MVGSEDRSLHPFKAKNIRTFHGDDKFNDWENNGAINANETEHTRDTRTDDAEKSRDITTDDRESQGDMRLLPAHEFHSFRTFTLRHPRTRGGKTQLFNNIPSYNRCFLTPRVISEVDRRWCCSWPRFGGFIYLFVCFCFVLFCFCCCFYFVFCLSFVLVLGFFFVCFCFCCFCLFFVWVFGGKGRGCKRFSCVRGGLVIRRRPP